MVAPSNQRFPTPFLSPVVLLLFENLVLCDAQANARRAARGSLARLPRCEAS